MIIYRSLWKLWLIKWWFINDWNTIVRASLDTVIVKMAIASASLLSSAAINFVAAIGVTKAFPLPEVQWVLVYDCLRHENVRLHAEYRYSPSLCNLDLLVPLMCKRITPWLFQKPEFYNTLPTLSNNSCIVGEHILFLGIHRTLVPIWGNKCCIFIFHEIQTFIFRLWHHDVCFFVSFNDLSVYTPSEMPLL